MKTNTVVYTVGRFQPLTLGHEKLAKAVASNAKKENGDAVLYTTASYDPVNNPLKYSQKTFWLKKAFSKFVKVSTNKNSTNPFTAAEELAKTYDHLIPDCWRRPNRRTSKNGNMVRSRIWGSGKDI